MQRRTAGWRACGSQARAAHSDASPAPEREWRHPSASPRRSQRAPVAPARPRPAPPRSRAAICCANAGSRPAGWLNPCRTALREERALPSGVLGPRLRRPLARLASRLAALIMQSPKVVTQFTFCSTTIISGMQAKKLRSAGCGRAVMPPLTRSSSQILSWTRPTRLKRRHALTPPRGTSKLRSRSFSSLLHAKRIV